MSIRSTSGFSLVEILVTIAAASILLAVAAPAFTAMVVSNRLALQTKDVADALSLARSEGVRTNSRVSFCRADSASATTCAAQAGAWEHWIVSSDRGGAIRGGETKRGSIAVPSNLPADAFAFGPDGLARPRGALVSDRSIILCATNGRSMNIRRITLAPGGRNSIDSIEGPCLP